MRNSNKQAIKMLSRIVVMVARRKQGKRSKNRSYDSSNSQGPWVAATNKQAMENAVTSSRYDGAARRKQGKMSKNGSNPSSHRGLQPISAVYSSPLQD